MLPGSLFQYEYGDEASKAVVVKMMPNKVKKRRKVQTEAGVSGFKITGDNIIVLVLQCLKGRTI